ncbi:MAG: NitT/TauT family transport system permease protein [Chthoniobacter sp.]|nr:NitT/TauT family transport system permease protein [Chthoniobacter sp.]
MAEPSTSFSAPAVPPAGAAAPCSTAPHRPRIHLFALRRDLPQWIYNLAAAAGFLTLIGAWWWLSHSGHVETAYLPTPEKVWITAFAVLQDETVWADIKISFLRVTGGFLLSAAIALPLGIWMGSWKIVEGFVQPLTEFIRYVPVPALIPILMLLFDIGELSKVMLIFVGTFFQLVLMVADEVRRVPYELLQVSYTLGAKKGEVVRLVLMRAAMPGIFDALRLCNGWAWTYLVVAELIAANEGLGYRVLKFYRFVQVPKIFVYLMILGALGLLLDFLFRKFNAHVFHWADTTKR